MANKEIEGLRTMQFYPELKEFLLKNNLIYTVRKYDMDSRLVSIDGVGVCKRIALGPIDINEELILYYKDSGFDSIESWRAKIKEINPKVKNFFLYRVEVLK